MTSPLIITPLAAGHLLLRQVMVQRELVTAGRAGHCAHGSGAHTVPMPMEISAGPGFALLLDATGTLLELAEPVAGTYARVAADHGLRCSAEEVGQRFEAAVESALVLRQGSPDWSWYWREVVRVATGSESEALFEELHEHFSRPGAWRIAPGARECCDAVRARGMRVAVVSNWDTRLRPLLAALGVTGWVDEVVVSGEELIEKPDPRLFRIACQRLGVDPARALHLGDSQRCDIEGARAAGCQAWLWGRDVTSFDQLARRLAEAPGPGSP